MDPRPALDATPAADSAGLEERADHHQYAARSDEGTDDHLGDGMPLEVQSRPPDERNDEGDPGEQIDIEIWK